MRQSPLILENYFVTELIFSANKEYDPAREGGLGLDELIIEPTCLPAEDGNHQWQGSLSIRFQPKAETNYPYTFSLELVGFFSVLGDPSPEREEFLVKTNAPSMLFGAAREIIRSATSRGPFSPILLPSVSFYEPKKSDDDPPTEQAAEPPTAQ